jgi:N-6 DNA Methylase.
MLKTEKINELIGVDDSWKAPEKLFSTLLNSDARIKLFRNFLKYETDMSFDWFHMYFQDEAADRKKKKQDFTPQSVASLMNRLADPKIDDYFETAAGTGGILIDHYLNGV